MTTPWKPTKAQLLAATEKTVADVIAPDLLVLFCGINPGLYTAAVGHHFARPGNRFWPALHAGGFTERVLSPFDERELLKSGYGITNVVPRTTATADSLTKEEIVAGGEELETESAAVPSESACCARRRCFRTAFNQPKAIGRQSDDWRHDCVGVAKPEWLERSLPGRGELARLFSELKEFADTLG